MIIRKAFLKTFTVLLFFLFATCGWTQQTPVKKELIVQDETVYTHPDSTAFYPGGSRAFSLYFVRHFRSTEEEMGGTVDASFIVEKDGTLSDIKFEGQIGEKTAKELTRLLKQSPQWVPARNEGQFVRSRYVMPVTFGIR